MASVASQLVEEVTAHAQSDSLEDVREICADGSYFPNNPCTYQSFPAVFLLSCWLIESATRESAQKILRNWMPFYSLSKETHLLFPLALKFIN